MELRYNISGSDRKKLVGAMVDILKTPQKYLGVPTCAYMIGEYHIDKAGTLTGPDNLDLEDTLHQKGFDAGERKYDEPDTYESGLDGLGAADKFSETPAGAYENNTIDTFTVEIPLKGFTPEKLDNLTKLVASKAPLLKAVLGTEDLPIQRTEDTLKFPWFWSKAVLTGEEVTAYTTLISLLCKTAKTKKRVTAKEREVNDNPKYAFRCWLLSLGMIGSEYKAARHILLRNLPGNSSFRDGVRPDKK